MSKTMKLSPEEKLREQYKRNVRLFVQRLIKMAKEQIVLGRNYGWTQDSMSQELILFIDKEISLAGKRGEERVKKPMDERRIKTVEQWTDIIVKGVVDLIKDTREEALEEGYNNGYRDGVYKKERRIRNFGDKLTKGDCLNETSSSSL